MVIGWILILFVFRSEADRQADQYDDLANDIRATMNTSIDPCNDFYEFACGGWLTSSNASLKPSKSKVAKSFTITSDTNQAILYDLIRRNATDQRVRQFTRLCMDLESIESHDLDSPSFISYWNEIDAIDSVQDVLRVAGHLRKINVAFVIDSEVVVNNQAPEHYIVALKPAGLILKNPNIYKSVKNAKLKAYKDHIGIMLSTFGVKNAESSAEAIVAFERKIYSARKVSGQSSRSNVSSTEAQMSLEDLIKSTGVHWSQYLTAAALKMTTDTKLVLKYPQVITKISAVFRAAPISILKSYLTWSLISEISPFLPKRISQLDFDFSQKLLLGKQNPPPRWRYCTEIADQYLSELTGPAFVNAKFPPVAKAEVTEILNNTMLAFGAQFRQLEWMDAPTIKQAIDKIANMKALIGYPDNWDSNKYNDVQFYGNLSFAEIMMQIKSNDWSETVKTLGQQVDRGKWSKPVSTVNAFYTPTMNSITFPAGILQRPFYSAGYPITMNFGGIGFIMTHELVHGFDDKGRQYNRIGGLKQWWPEHVLKAYKQRVQCYREQYSRMKDNDPIAGNITVNANRTMGENIADNGAVDVGLRAMHLYLQSHPAPDPVLPEFTPDQTYFLSVGQMFCSRMRPELARLLQATNPHPPSRIRINAIMANSDLFSNAYQCRPGSPMNPPRKCDLWRGRAQEDCP